MNVDEIRSAAALIVVVAEDELTSAESKCLYPSIGRR
jgi:hypothetical protein